MYIAMKHVYLKFQRQTTSTSTFIFLDLGYILRMTFQNMPIYLRVLQFYFTKQMNDYVKVTIFIDHS